MPPGKYGMQEEWEQKGDQEINMDFLLPTGIFLKFPVSRNDTIKNIKKVHVLTLGLFINNRLQGNLNPGCDNIRHVYHRRTLCPIDFH